jgi:hypothetical protein
MCRIEQQVPWHRDLLASWAAPVAALHLVSGAGRRFSTWNQTSSSQIVGQRDPHRHTEAAHLTSANPSSGVPSGWFDDLSRSAATSGTPEGATTPAPAAKRPRPSTTTLPLFARSESLRTVATEAFFAPPSAPQPRPGRAPRRDRRDQVPSAATYFGATRRWNHRLSCGSLRMAAWARMRSTIPSGPCSASNSSTARPRAGG